MRTTTLFDRPEGCKDEHRNAVVDELGMLMSQRLRLFRAYVTMNVERDPASFVFVTTHKDTALMFSTFSDVMLRHLGYLLLEEFISSGESHILVYKGGDSEDGWFVTLTNQPWQGEHTFTFSPAQGRVSA